MYVAIIAPVALNPDLSGRGGMYIANMVTLPLKPQRGDMCGVKLVIADKYRIWKLLGLTQLDVHSPVVRRFIADRLGRCETIPISTTIPIIRNKPAHAPIRPINPR